ncbi:MAG: Eco57I restriction-modification methylase domain-containing protein, partial [Clostridia bacterium]|nr:Eco57I restriction-modification methylase domain-containing protein [Clostridia bacterium]
MTADIKKIEGIIESEFEMQKFVSLISEIFPSAKAVSPYKVQREFSNFSSHIVGCSHVANYKTSDNKQVLIFAVELKKDFFVENSRSTQRSYAKKLIENGNADAAIIAFHTAGNPRWRLSFVRLGYEMKFEESKLKSVEKLTPARRYSFLVGKDEPSHTAIERLQFIAVVRNGMPTLDELEEAFSVEKVTKEFFELYCEKYQELHDFLIQNKDFIIESENCGFTAEQFAKKLMGQIVFLYFLQKKGWLGVNVWPDSLSEKEFKDVYCTGGVMGNKIREHLPQLYVKRGNEYRRQSSVLDTLPEDVEEAIANNLPKNKTGAWGEGSKKFLRTVYDFAMRHNANFYNDYLEPLFYNTLNRYRGDMGYCQLLHCRIPFLSGGLFEPIKGYDWKNSVLNIPNEIFSNKQGADGTTGDGILDIFDRYNFTMSEDEPLEREVAIDPEMLGKVFENLLDIKDRKSKGAFYTPREIVHYMCQESLIKYLVNSTGLSEDGIRDFILYGDFMKDEDTVKEKRLGNSGMYIADDIFKIDSKGNITADRLKDIDDALVNIRVCDPAVGSGAFPVGMLNEIVRARQNLTEYMAVAEKIRVGEAQAKHTVYTLRSNRTPYILKRNAIKNSIFAVDIEPSAVDIAQLRLWLSLVIDDEINPEASSILEGHRNPTPLPNLECNILCGNSLKDKFDGKPLLNYSNLICRKTDVQHIDMAWAEFEDMLPKLFDIQDKIFSCDNPERKVEYLKQLESIKHTMLKLQLYGITYEQWNRFVETEEMASKPYILWQLDFARVFREKGGFDVVIGNPPYIQLQLATGGPNDEKFGDLYIDEGFDTFVKKGDIFCLFYEKGLQLLREGGILTFITSNKWMRTEYGEKLRGYLAKYNPVLLIDFAGQKIFETATVDVNILLIEKISNKGATTTCVAQEGCRKNLSEFIKQNHCIQEFNSSDL